jgi:hypothetical protein
VIKRYFLSIFFSFYAFSHKKKQKQKTWQSHFHPTTLLARILWKIFSFVFFLLNFIGRLDIVLWMWFDRLGDPCRRPLCVLPAAVHAERARVDRHLHSGCHAGDPRVRRPRSHQHLHFGS